MQSLYLLTFLTQIGSLLAMLVIGKFAGDVGFWLAAAILASGGIIGAIVLKRDERRDAKRQTAK